MDEHYAEAFLKHKRVDDGVCAETLRSYRRSLREYAAYLDACGVASFAAAQSETIMGYFRTIISESGLAEATICGKTQPIYVLYEWLKRQGVILFNPCPKPPVHKRSLPRTIPRKSSIIKTYRKLYNGDGKREVRNYAIIDLAYSCGLRRREIVNLDVEDLCVEEGTLRVRGKYGNERVVPIGKRTLRNVRFYLYHARPKFLKHTKTKALFVTAREGGRRISPLAINRIFEGLRKRYGCPESITTHALRHAFATDLLRNGAPLQDVSKMLGHADLDTTQIYTRVLPLDLKRAHRKYHPRG
jgi:site-specific recombinase XerD